ncbi:MAG: T9SS type A sorting domain-containing protein [Ignavibacteriaceae bacterium]|nr:T9SS type A sorting domain-containing protein [Ignavibacteriaceae bacterium]
MIIALLICFLLITPLRAQGEGENRGYLVKPVAVGGGVIFTDNYGSGIYQIKNGIIQKIISSPGSGNFFTLAPGGKSVVVKVSEARGQKLTSVSLETGFQSDITGFHEVTGQASFSKTGKFVYSIGAVLMVSKDEVTSKYLLPDYANLTPISPDGNFVAYNDREDQLFLLDLKSGSPVRITDPGKGYFHPQWSPSSEYILFSSLDAGMYIYSLSSGRSVSFGRGFNPSLSPDGKSVVYEFREEKNGVFGNSDLFIYYPESNKAIQLTFTPDKSEMTPSITPDGSLLYTVREEKSLYTTNYTPESGLLSPQLLFRSKEGYIEESRKEISLTPPSEVMNIPYVHQVWDTPDWYNGHAACGAATAIMLIAHWDLLPAYEGWCSWPSPGHYNYYGRYIADRYRFRQVDYQFSADDPNGTPSYGGYGFMWTGSFSPYSRMVSYYGNHGISASREDSPPFSKAEAQVNAGYPYTICNGLTTSGHIVLGHAVNATNRSVTVNDPYGNKNTPGYPSYDGKNAVYDWPGYNNGYQNFNTVFWSVNTAYTVPAHGDTLIDDLDFDRGFYLHNRFGVTMLNYKDMTQGYKGHFWYTTTQSGMNDFGYVTWKPNIPADGMYEVKVYIPFSNATDVLYRVIRHGGITEVPLNQKLYTNQWVSLGVHPFKAGTAGYLRLGDKSASSGQEVVFDAAQWNLVDPVLHTDEVGNSAPGSFGITANYPNPFNPSTKISFTVTEGGYTQLAVYNILGGLEAELINGILDAGDHSAEFSAAGRPSGTYLAVLRSGDKVSVSKLLLMK